MMKDLNTVNKYCYVNYIEEKILIGTKKPILILNKKNNILPENISYNNPTLGVMLPYTPLHYLLFDEELDILVMTSGNISGLPMISENKEAINSLTNVADYYLVHNRHIHMPVDDSVVKVVLDEERVIRSARGYSPMNYKHKVKDTLALGSELKNTFSISKSDYIFMSQYIGDISSMETLDHLRKNIKNFMSIYDIKPKILAYDNHPNFIYKDYIKKIHCEKVGVYHHHAHIVSCMFENNVEEKVLGLAFDGAGYGRDNHIWGSEFLICNCKNFTRVGHLKYFKMPGGDSATKEPWKMAISLISEIYKKNEFINETLNDYRLNYLKNKNYKLILSMLNNNINSPLSSSMGRFFDGVSGMLGFEDKITFEGEACIALENLAQKYVECNDFYKFNINYLNNEFIIDHNSIVKSILEDIKDNKPLDLIAIKFHNTVVEFSLDLCKKIRSLYKINKVALSGGVFQNNIIFTKLHNKLEEEKFQVLTHKLLPCNDSSISVGQLIIANNRREKYVCSNSG
ncbi:Carbamoyltransferase HypF [bioreactor metagenome]|uniref:Carbamoyl phosphate-converting enzyme HypF n=1 Tax=bioreactor metagenome TaxID=1076179 RepID=A0A645AZJ6_9ZZZZ